MALNSLLTRGRKAVLSFVRACFVLLAAASLGGCLASLSGAPDRLFTLEEETRSAKIVSSPERYEEYARSFGQRKFELRNQIVLSRMYAIDMLYSDYEARLTRERQEVGFYSTVVNLALNSAGTLAGGAATKATLHAISAGLVGAKTSYEKDILIERTVSILQKQMRVNRKEVKTQIVERLSGSTSAYPLEFALTDVERYYRAGTISGALLGVDADVSLKLDQATEEEDRAIMRNVRRQTRSSFTNQNPGSARRPVVVTRLVDRTPNITGADLNEVEKKIGKPFGEAIQANLCVPIDGDFGDSTRQAIRTAKRAANQSARAASQPAVFADEDGSLSQNDVQIFLDARGCRFDRTGVDRSYANAFEKYRFSNQLSVAEFQAQLQRCAAQAGAQTSPPVTANVAPNGVFDTATRQAIKLVKSRLARGDRFVGESEMELGFASTVEIRSCRLKPQGT